MDTAGQFDFPRSTSQRRTYRTCPTKYMHHYVGNWRPTTDRGTYAFGSVMQDSLQMGLDLYAAARNAEPDAILTLPNVAGIFREKWSPFEHDETRTWTSRASWGQLNAWGQRLITLALQEVVGVVDVSKPMLYEPKITFPMGDDTELALPDFIGWVMNTNGQPVPTILDWKTSDRAYEPLQVELDDQLTDYQLAANRDPEIQQVLKGPIQQVGLVVLIYGPNPRLQWLLTPARTPEELASFEASAASVNRLIRQGVFYRNERACFQMGKCPMIPLCYPSQRDQIATQLKQVAAHTPRSMPLLEAEKLARAEARSEE